jgi:hypothetical protein
MSEPRSLLNPPAAGDENGACESLLNPILGRLPIDDDHGDGLVDDGAPHMIDALREGQAAA